MILLQHIHATSCYRSSTYMLYSQRGLLMHPALIAVIVIVVIRRFRREPVDAKDLAVSPVILPASSVKDLWDFEHWTAALAVFLTVSIYVELGFGLLAGAPTVMCSREATRHQRYTAKTLVVWVISLAAGAGLHFGAQFIGAEEAVRPMTLSIGLSLLGEAIACGWRGVQTGIPF